MAKLDLRISKLMKLAEKSYDKKTYIHALRVACFASDMALNHRYIDDVDAFLVGLAHDLIEDTDCPQEDLWNILGEDLTSSVIILTKADDIEYKDYIQDILNSKDDLAILVKRADMKDHLTQYDTLTDKLKEKYLPVIGMLM